MKAFCDAFLEFKEDRASFKAQRVFSLLGVDAPRKDDELYNGLIRITDFVCGSTDRYATELSRRLSGVGF
jgi:dGTP triphosphohydrolase